MEGPNTKKLSEAITTLQESLKTYEEVRADYLEAQEQAEEMLKRASIRQVAADTAWHAFFDAEKKFRAISDEYRGVDLS
jgi:hypothetical protein